MIGCMLVIELLVGVNSTVKEEERMSVCTYNCVGMYSICILHSCFLKLY